MQEPETKWERWFKLLLRIEGSISLLAVVFIFVPYSWMNDIHGWLGMGSLPADPVVGYLARSTSAFYAILGGLFWVLSFDLRRYRAVLFYISYAAFFLGAVLLIVDWSEGMPFLWRLWEGPFVIVFGLLMLFFSSLIAVKPQQSA